MAKNTAEDNLKGYLEDYRSWLTYTNDHKTNWDNYWKLYGGERVKRNYSGDADVFDPMVLQMIETGVDNVYGPRPEVTFDATHRDQERNTELLKGMWEYTYDANNMDSRMLPFGRETKIIGNGAMWGEPADGYMKIIHKPFRQCIFDPAGVDEETISFGGYWDYYLLDDLKRAKTYDPKTEQWVEKYSNLDKIKLYNAPSSGEQTDKEVKDAYNGSTLPDNQKNRQVHVIKLYYRDKVVEIANLNTIIYEADNPWRKDAYTIDISDYDETQIPDDIENTPEAVQAYLDANPGLEIGSYTVEVAAIEGFIPVALNRRRVDPALLIAAGDVEPIADSQELLNDMINVKVDLAAHSVKGLTVFDSSRPQNAGLESRLGNYQPGDIVGVDGGMNAIGAVMPNDFSRGVDSEINRIKQSIRDTARIDQVVQGVSNTDNKTATEINAQMAQATGGFSTEVRSLETGFYKRLGEMFIKYLQIFVTSKQIVRVMGRDGVEWKEYDPNQFWGLYDAKVVLDTTARARQKEEADKAMELYKMLGGDPEINQQELKKRVLKKVFDMDQDDIERLFMAAPQMPPMDAMAPVQPGMAPGMAQPGADPMAQPDPTALVMPEQMNAVQ